MSPLADGFSLLQSWWRRRPDSDEPLSTGDPNRHSGEPGHQIPGDPNCVEPPAVERLVGAHADLADELAALVRSPEESEDRVVLLRAASGHGKSRVVREVYRRLAESDSYWPGLPGWGADGDLATRKQLGPDPTTFKWAKDALPTFAWWHLNCEDLVRGSAADFTADLERQLKAHTIPLEFALNWGDDGYRRLAQKAGDELGDWVADLIAGKVRDQAVSTLSQLIPVPFLAQVIGLGTLGAKELSEQLRNRRALRSVVDTGAIVSEDRATHIVALAEFVRALSSPTIPAVVVIEDLHAMSAELVVFLDALLARGQSDEQHRVLVIATDWPEGSRAPHQGWIGGPHSVDVSELAPLTSEDLSCLVRAAAEGTSDAVALDVASAFDNPLALKRWLARPTVQRTIERLGGALTAGAVAPLRIRMTEASDDLQQERWNELADHVQTALMYAIASDGASEGSVGYVPSVVTDVVAAGDVQRTASLRPAFDAAVTSAAWARRLDDLDFTEDAATRCIARAARSDLPLEPAELADLPRRASRSSEEYLRRFVHSAAVGAPLRSTAASHVAGRLLSVRPDDTTPEGRLLATYVLAVDRYYARDLSATLDMLLPLAEQAPGETSARSTAPIAVLAARCVLTVAPKDPTSLEQVSLMLAAALAAGATGRSLGEDETDTVQRHADEVGHRLAAARNGDVGVFLERRADAIRASSSRATAEETVAALAHLAFLTYDTHGRKRAVPRMREAFDLARAELGADAPLTMDTAIAYLTLVGHDGVAAKHVTLVSELVEVARSAYGERDHRTLDLLRQQLRWELKASASEDLAMRFDALVQTTGHLVGPLGAMSVTARMEQAEAWARWTDGAERGVELINALLAEATRAFGVSHPITRKVDWWRTHRVEPFALHRPADTSRMLRAAPNGDSRSATHGWTAEAAAALRAHYGVLDT